MTQENSKSVPRGDEIYFSKRYLGQINTICRLHNVISALPTSQTRTGLLGLEQGIWALKAKNVLGDQLKRQFQKNVYVIHFVILGDGSI
jgi:hypothetical protein